MMPSLEESDAQLSIQVEEEDENEDETEKKAIVEEEVASTTLPPRGENDTTTSRIRYRRYLIDRTNGTCRLGSTRPPCFACWVPKPVVWFSGWIEQNSLFEALGQFGCFAPDNLRARTVLIGLGLVCNIACLCLSIYVCLAVSTTKSSWIKASAFTRAFVNAQPSHLYPYRHNLWIGIQAAVIYTYIDQYQYQYSSESDNNNNIPEDWKGPTETVVPFDEFCGLSAILIPHETCGACAKVSDRLVATLFVSLLMTIPSITTSVLRLYPHYDCNCQKVFGGFAAIISVGFAIYTFVIYQFRCFKSFGFGRFICVDPNDLSNVSYSSSCDLGNVTVESSFFAGAGWISLAVATGLKILDMLFQLAIPTPTICRDQEEQRQYEELVVVATTNREEEEYGGWREEEQEEEEEGMAK